MPLNRFFNDTFEMICWENENLTIAERVHYGSLQSHLKMRVGNRAFLDDNVVDAIYMECRISDSNKRVLMDVAKHLGVECYQMRINPIANRLEKEKVDFDKTILE